MQDPSRLLRSGQEVCFSLSKPQKERFGPGWDENRPGWPPLRDLDGFETLCNIRWRIWTGLDRGGPLRTQDVRCQIAWPFFCWKLCRKAHIVGVNVKGDSGFPLRRRENRRNRALTDVNRCYFGIYGQFSVVNRRSCRRFPAKKGPGNLMPKGWDVDGPRIGPRLRFRWHP